MSFQPTTAHSAAARREEGTLQLYTSALIAFKAYVLMGNTTAADRERDVVHQRLDQHLDAYASGVALMQRDIDKGIAE